MCYCVLCLEQVHISEFPLLSDMFTAAKPSRKRRWGSTSVREKPVLSINISTDSLRVQLLIVDIFTEL